MQKTNIDGRATPTESTQKARGRIEGGSISIAPISIIIVWAAYRKAQIDWRTLRVWFALWEVKRWHEKRVRAGEPYSYDVAEIRQALKTERITKKQVEDSLATLQTLGIIEFSATVIAFATQVDSLADESLRDQATEMLSHLNKNNYQKGINFPRRILKYIISAKRRNDARIGTTLGLLIRCMLVKRDEYGRYKGCCRADWIATVFGGHTTSISSARSWLMARGWFIRLEGTHQRTRNLHGDWFALALEIVVVVEEEQPHNEIADEETTQAPVAVESLPKGVAPVENSESQPTEVEGPQTQKPAKLEGLYKPVSSLPENLFINQYTGVFRYQTPPQNQSTSWASIHPKDISNPERREKLFADVVDRGILGNNQADKLTFLAAASRAIRKATNNACGFLRSIIENPDYRGYISQDDEDQARLWLKDDEHRQIDKMIANRAPKRSNDSGTRPLPTLSLDALTVKQLTRDLIQAGYSGDLFRIVMSQPEGRKYLEGWNRERWQAAELELVQFRARTHAAQTEAKKNNIDSAGGIIDDWLSGGHFRQSS